MTLISFLAKQFIDVIEWNEPEDGILTYRYPMQDLEIQNGGQLTVSESQMAAFVNDPPQARCSRADHHRPPHHDDAAHRLP